jgi:hypothetical protein
MPHSEAINWHKLLEEFFFNFIFSHYTQWVSQKNQKSLLTGGCIPLFKMCRNLEKKFQLVTCPPEKLEFFCWRFNGCKFFSERTVNSHIFSSRILWD